MEKLATEKQINFIKELKPDFSDFEGLTLKKAAIIIGGLLKAKKQENTTLKATLKPAATATEAKKDLFCFEEFKKACYKTNYYYYDEKQFNKRFKYVIKIKDLFLVLDYPEIETSFCFADDYDAPDNEFSSDKMIYKAENDKQYFIDENMKSVQGKIDYLKKNQFAFFKSNYKNQLYYNSVYVLGDTAYIRNYDTPAATEAGYMAIMTTEEKQQIITALEEIKKDFEKRLNAYLKRFGLSKINAWSYWANR